jgi:hypothetical protein
MVLLVTADFDQLRDMIGLGKLLHNNNPHHRLRHNNSGQNLERYHDAIHCSTVKSFRNSVIFLQTLPCLLQHQFLL